MNAQEQAKKAGSGINFFPKEHVWVPTGIASHSWDTNKLTMTYAHRRVNSEDEQRRRLVLEMLSRDTSPEAKNEIRVVLQQLKWPCNE